MLHALLQVVWTEMCVGSVCTQPLYNDKNPPCFFLNLLRSLPLSQIELIRCLSVWRHMDEGRSHDSLIDSTVLAQTAVVSYLRPALRAVISCFTAGADVDKNDS